MSGIDSLGIRSSILVAQATSRDTSENKKEATYSSEFLQRWLGNPKPKLTPEEELKSLKDEQDQTRKKRYECTAKETKLLCDLLPFSKEGDSLSFIIRTGPPFNKEATAANDTVPILKEYSRRYNKYIDGPELREYPYKDSKILGELNMLNLSYQEPNKWKWLALGTTIAAGILWGVAESIDSNDPKKHEQIKRIRSNGCGAFVIGFTICGFSRAYKEPKKIINNFPLDRNIEKANIYVRDHNAAANCYNERIALRKKEEELEKAIEEQILKVEGKTELLAAIDKFLPLNDSYMTMGIFNDSLKKEMCDIKSNLQGLKDMGRIMKKEELEKRVNEETAKAKEMNDRCAKFKKLYEEKENALYKLREPLTSLILKYEDLFDEYLSMDIFKETLKEKMRGIQSGLSDLRWKIKDIGVEEPEPQKKINGFKNAVYIEVAKAKKLAAYCAMRHDLFDKLTTVLQATIIRYEVFDQTYVLPATKNKIMGLISEIKRLAVPAYFAQNENVGYQAIAWHKNMNYWFDKAEMEQKRANAKLAETEKLLAKYEETVCPNRFDINMVKNGTRGIFSRCAETGNFRDLAVRFQELRSEISSSIARQRKSLTRVYNVGNYLQRKWSESRLYPEDYASFAGTFSSLTDRAACEDVTSEADLLRSEIYSKVMWNMLDVYGAGVEKRSSSSYVSVSPTIFGHEIYENGALDVQFVVHDKRVIGTDKKSYIVIRVKYDDTDGNEHWYLVGQRSYKGHRFWRQLKSFF